MKSYFTDGNLFVRVGILVLFFGVAFLLKYAAEHSNIPVEVRYIAAAMGGLFLLAAGWRLRTKKFPLCPTASGCGYWNYLYYHLRRLSAPGADSIRDGFCASGRLFRGLSVIGGVAEFPRACLLWYPWRISGAAAHLIRQW